MSACAHLPPYGVGVAPMTPNGLPTSAPAPYGRDSQSMALLSTAGIVPLYSGVTRGRGRPRRPARAGAAAAAGMSSRRRRPRCRTARAEAVDDLDGDALGRLVAERLGELAVDGVGAEAADEDGDGGVSHDQQNGPRSVFIPESVWRARLYVPRVNRAMSEPRLLPLARRPAAGAPRRRAQPGGAAARRPGAGRAGRRRRGHHGRGRGRGRRRQGHGLPPVRVPRGTDGGAAQPPESRVAGLGDERARRRWVRAPSPRTGCWPSAAPGWTSTLEHADLIRDAGRAGAPLLRRVLLRRDARALPARRARRPRRPRRCSPSRCSPRSRCRSSTSRCGSSGSTLERIHAGWATSPAGSAADLSDVVATQPEGEAVDQRAPGRLDHVGADADRDPRRLAVAGLDQHPGDRVGAVALVEDPHLVVDQLELRDLREGLADRRRAAPGRAR